MRAIFGMGIPVSAKNLFPSNIAGLPTWYTIRINEEGWLAQPSRTDVLVAMNPMTLQDDVSDLEPGTIVVINATLLPALKRDDLDVYAVPFDELAKAVCKEAPLRKLVTNVVYVGVVAYLLGIEMTEVDAAIDRVFGAKPRATELNKTAAQVGYDWARESTEPQDRVRVERSNRTEGKILIDGNEAVALGLMFGGLTVLAWYPITPSSSVCERLSDYLDQYRRDPETGKATYAVVQAEDEIASIGMVLGASWAGARSATATSGPGLSLMAEMAGLSYFAEIPAVIIDVQRMGPSTGLPTRNSQGDIASAYQLSHGDTKHVLLIPGNVEECYEFAMLALDLAQRLQTLILVMSDLDLGMNTWMAEPFEAPTKPLDRGKVLSAEDLERVGEFARYRDVDGDGIPYRTLPGTDHPKAAYFTRGTGHNENAQYTESSEMWLANMDRLTHKFETAREIVPKPMVEIEENVKVGIIAYGSSDLAVQEARHILAGGHDLNTNYLRIRSLPLDGEVKQFLQRHEVVYLVEQNKDGQMAAILHAELPELATNIRSVLHYDGNPLNALSVVRSIAADRLLEEGSA